MTSKITMYYVNLGNVKCKETSFDLIPNRILDARDKVIVTSSLSYCLQQCLSMAEDCNSAMFFKDRVSLLKARTF